MADTLTADTPRDVLVRVPSVDEIESMWNSADDRELDRLLVELENARRLVEGAIVAVTRRAEATGGHMVDGHRHPAGWQLAVAGVSPAVARRRAALSRFTRQGLHAWAAAVTEGSVGVDQAVAFARVAGNPRVADRLGEFETMLLGFARTLPYPDFVRALGFWERRADQDGALADHDLNHRTRGLSIAHVGSRCVIRGECDSTQGTIISQLLQQFIDAEHRADRDAVAAAGGGELARTGRQRNIDALVAALTAAAHSPDRPTGVTPTVNLLVDPTTLAEWADHAAGGPVPEPDLAGFMRRRCHTPDGVPLDPRQAVAAALIGKIRVIITDTAGQPTATGPARRWFSSDIRSAVTTVDGICLWPGCTMPAATVDHLQPWHRGGPSTVDNAGGICHHHNLFKSHRHTATRATDGTWTIIRPDGSVFHGRPPPGPASRARRT